MNILPCKNTGYYCHFGQAIWRKVKASRLTKMYNSNHRFRKHIDAIGALYCILLGRLDEAWYLIEGSYFTVDKRILELFNYVKSTWHYNSQSLFS